MRSRRVIPVILMLVFCLVMVSCDETVEKPELSIEALPAETPSATPVNIPSDLPEVIETTEAFSYVEYVPKDGAEPYYSYEYGCSDNLIMCRFNENGQIHYGFMDLSFNLISGPVSDKPAIFNNGYSMLEKDGLKTLIDYDFNEVDIFAGKWFEHDGKLASTKYADSYYLFDIDTHLDMGFSDMLVPVPTDRDPISGEQFESFLTGYKTLEDAYIEETDIAEGWVLDPVFERAGFFNYWYAVFSLDGKYGCIDYDGNIIIDPEFEDLLPLSDYLFTVIKSDETSETTRKYKIYDIDGNPLSGYDFINVRPLDSGYIKAVLPSHKSIYFDPYGKKVNPEGHLSDWDFSEGLLQVMTEKGRTFIDETGKQVFDMYFSQAKNFTGGYAAVSDNMGNWGYIDKTGKEIIQVQYHYAGDFSFGYAFVQEAPYGEHYLIDKDGNEYLGNLNLTEVSLFNKDGHALAYSEQKNGNDLYRTYYMIKINDTAN